MTDNTPINDKSALAKMKGALLERFEAIHGYATKDSPSTANTLSNVARAYLEIMDAERRNSYRSPT
jgi:hypothetical protein